MSFVLAFDPGPTRTGLASVSYAEGRFALCASDHLMYGGGFVFEGKACPWTGDGLHAYLDDAASVGALVAIETVRGRVYPGRAPESLFETRATEGRLMEACRQRGVEPQLWTARAWRRLLTGEPAASDDQIALVVRGIVHGIPQDLPYRKSPHMFDAAGLAVVSLAQGLGMAFPRDLPASVVASLMRQQAEDKARRVMKGLRKASAGRRKK